MAPVGRDLLAGDEHHAGGRARGGQLGVVGHGVVVGDGEEVQARLGRQVGQRRHGQRAVGVHRVRVQVPGEPGEAGRCGQRPGWRTHRRSGHRGVRRRPGGRRSDRRRLRGHCPRQALRRYPVQAEEDLPGAGDERAGQVPRGRVGGGDGERRPGPAGPAPEPPVRVEAAEVEHAPVPLERDGQRRGPGRYVDREVAVVLRGAVGGVPHSTVEDRHPSRPPSETR